MEVPSTEVQNNFGRYLKLANFEEIIVTRNGKRVAVLEPYRGQKDLPSMSAEQAGGYDPGSKALSYEDFLKLAEGSERRFEYIDGEVHALTSPSFDHQAVIMELAQLLYRHFEGEKCRPLTAPLDITLSVEKSKSVVQPDLVVICDTENIDKTRHYSGVPDLAVEVLSASTRMKDMVKKLNLYLCGGVKEYWIVNPFRREIYTYLFEEDDVKDYRVYKGGEILKSAIFDGLEAALEQVFAPLNL